MDNGNTLKYRVEQLEKKVEKADAKLDTVLTNHLPHIQKELIKLNTQVKLFTGLNIFALIIAILINRYLVV